MTATKPTPYKLSLPDIDLIRDGTRPEPARAAHKALHRDMGRMLNHYGAENRSAMASEVRDYAAAEELLYELEDIAEKLRGNSDALARLHPGTNATGGQARPGIPLGRATMASYVRARGMVRDGEDSVGLGTYLRGTLTGNWSGVSTDIRAALLEGTATAGGHLVPTPLSARIIDRAVPLPASCRPAPSSSRWSPRPSSSPASPATPPPHGTPRWP